MSGDQFFWSMTMAIFFLVGVTVGIEIWKRKVDVDSERSFYESRLKRCDVELDELERQLRGEVLPL